MSENTSDTNMYAYTTNGGCGAYMGRDVGLLIVEYISDWSSYHALKSQMRYIKSTMNYINARNFDHFTNSVSLLGYDQKEYNRAENELAALHAKIDQITTLLEFPTHIEFADPLINLMEKRPYVNDFIDELFTTLQTFWDKPTLTHLDSVRGLIASITASINTEVLTTFAHQREIAVTEA